MLNWDVKIYSEYLTIVDGTEMAVTTMGPGAIVEISDFEEYENLEFDETFLSESALLRVIDSPGILIFTQQCVESQNEPPSDPLIFWFNGGPGRPSLDGLLKGCERGRKDTSRERVLMEQDGFSRLHRVPQPEEWHLETDLSTKSIDTSARFAYGHGLIDEKIWNTLERDCCSGCIDSCDLAQVAGHCATLVEDTFQFLWFGGLNPYDLHRDCDPNPSVNSKRMSHMLRGVAPAMSRFDEQLKNQTKSKLYQFLKNKSQKPLTADVPCLNDTEMLSYMNDPKVREGDCSLLNGRLNRYQDTFITIRGVGHMAPQWRAPQMYYAVQQLLLNHPL
ncbi:hypothetical protein CRE_14716 [Caenorhabditis remanei]|uniref:Carboxypeptidase n=1 Tax=Caenorhabditis remanei TaxID=31234 RepID=E3M9Q3_CAERE|nr:hypothetical protein CRE_14716 [Caenorhabditis remanei]